MWYLSRFGWESLATVLSSLIKPRQHYVFWAWGNNLISTALTDQGELTFKSLTYLCLSIEFPRNNRCLPHGVLGLKLKYHSMCSSIACLYFLLEANISSLEATKIIQVLVFQSVAIVENDVFKTLLIYFILDFQKYVKT